jgi:phosphonate transport system substrate-binding protein
MPLRRSQEFLRFGISQGHGGTTLMEGARVFAQALSSELGRGVRVHVTDDYQGLLRATLDGEVEVAWMPPFLHLAATAKGAHLVAVCERGGAITYRSAVVVRADSQYRALGDLGGARAAWSDRSSAAGYVFPRLLIERSGVELGGETFVGSPRAVCAAVVGGQADVGACFVSEAAANDRERLQSDLTRVYPATARRLRTLGVTDPIPPDGIVVAAHVGADSCERVGEAVLCFHQRAEGRDALDKLLFAEKLVPVTDAVGRLVAELRVRPS